MDNIEQLFGVSVHTQGIHVYSVSCAHPLGGAIVCLWPWHVFIGQIVLSI